MALDTQMIDISLTQGVDTKMTQNTTLDTQFTEIINMRSDYSGGFIPRVGFTKTTSASIVAPTWVAANKSKTVYSNYRTIAGDITTSAVTAASGVVRRRAFGSQLLVQPLWLTSAAQSNKALVAWGYSGSSAGTAIVYQWYDPIEDTPTYNSAINLVVRDLAATSGPSNAYLWAINNSTNALVCYEVTVDGAATALTVSNGGRSLTIMDVVYDAGTSTWYVVYSEGAANGYLAKYTLSGSTMTEGSRVLLAAGSHANLAVTTVMGTGVTTYIGLARRINASTSVIGEVFSTALVLQNSYTSTAVTNTVNSLGVCDTFSNTPLYVTYAAMTTSVLPTIQTFSVSATSSGSDLGSLSGPFAAPSQPIALKTAVSTYAPFAATVDISNVNTYASAGLMPLSAPTATQSYRWSSGSAATTSTVQHRGQKIASIGARYVIPQVWEGAVTDITAATAGFGSISTQRVAGIVVIDETQSSLGQYFNFGTAQVFAGGQLYGLDSQTIGPASALPIPAIPASTLAQSNSFGALANARYSFRLLKRWSDSLGNICECVSAPFAITTTGANNTITFTLPASAFLLAHPAPSSGALPQIQIYVTEANGSIHYLWASTYSAVTATFQDVTTLNLAQPLIYDGGELEDQELASVKHMTSWQGRLVALTCDSDTTVYYSKPQENYRGARFAAGLQIEFPQAVGGLVALAGMDYTLYGFSQNEVYSVSGTPASSTGTDGSLGSPELRFRGIGCTNAKSVIQTPKGIAFQSSKGVYLILRNQELQFIGNGPFEDRALSVVGAYVDEQRSELHYVMSGNVEWVYNWQDNLWTSFIMTETPLACALQGSTPLFSGATGIWETASNSAEVIPLTMTSAWIATTGIQGFQRVRNILLLLKYLAAHTLTVTIYTDYNNDTAVQTYTINTATDVTTTTPYQIRLHLQNQKCEAVKIKITSPTAGWEISGLSMEIGVKRDHYKPRTAPNTY